MSSRNALLLQGLTLEDRLIEIGPSFAPVAPKSQGWNTVVVDHASQDELRAKYAQDPTVHTDRIETVDKIWNGPSLHDIFPEPDWGNYRAVIASHAIEHFPNPVAFLQSASRLTHAESGMVSLAVPDKRFCFDVFKPLTTTGDWLDALRHQHARHTGVTVFNHIAYHTTNGGHSTWTPQAPVDLALAHDVHYARDLFLAYDPQQANYVDAHAWIFTPASFELILFELYVLGLIDWRIARLEASSASEFIVTLSKTQPCYLSAADINARRLNLLRRTHAEILDQTHWMLDGALPPASPGALPSLHRDVLEIKQALKAMETTQGDLQRLLNLLRRLWSKLGPLRRLVRKPQ